MHSDPELDVEIERDVLVGARVLVVDDERLNRRLLRSILEKRGVEVIVAEGGIEGLARATELRPDLVLLDIMMPDLDGYQVCARLKADPETQRLPVIFVSATDQVAGKVHGFDLGAADYVTKPFSPGEILARIRTQLRMASLTESLRAANESLVEKQLHIEEDLKAAADIQRSLLPPRDEVYPGVDVAWRFLPCWQIGGDLFQIFRITDTRLLICIVDVSGHGVPSALVTVSLAQSLNRIVHTLRLPDAATGPMTPVEMCEMLDREYPIERYGKHFTAALFTLDTVTGELRYTNAAHDPPALVRADGSISLLGSNGPIVGLGDVIPYHEGQEYLRAGDRLVLYTDGIIEQENEAEVEFGLSRFLGLLDQARGLDLETACNRTIQGFLEYCSHEHPADDVSLLTVEFQGLRFGDR